MSASLSKSASIRPPRKRLLLVDDHAIFREGLSKIIDQERDLEVCGEAENALMAIQQARKLKPDMAIVDISLEGMNGLELIKSFRESSPNLRILVLSMHKESLYAERALRAGANGYIMKQESGSKLIEAIRRVLQGAVHVSEEINSLILQGLHQGSDPVHKSPVERLSDREFEVFQLISRGFGTRQIAEELNVSMKTIETHREHIREKLHVKSTFELVQYALDWSASQDSPR